MYLLRLLLAFTPTQTSIDLIVEVPPTGTTRSTIQGSVSVSVHLTL